jgi:hypothetical protein
MSFHFSKDKLNSDYNITIDINGINSNSACFFLKAIRKTQENKEMPKNQSISFLKY